MLKYLALAAAAVAIAPAAQAANLVQDGGFEEGSSSFVDNWHPTSWSLSINAHSGTSSARTSCGPGGFFICQIDQDVATTTDELYQLSFWARKVDCCSGLDQLRVEWNSETFVYDLNEAWTQYTIESLFGGTGDTSFLRFAGRTGSEYGEGDILLDDVSVDADSPAAVPEPATWALMLAGFGALGISLRRRRRAHRHRSVSIPGARKRSAPPVSIWDDNAYLGRSPHAPAAYKTTSRWADDLGENVDALI